MSHTTHPGALWWRAKKKGFFVTCDTYVTMTDGTGIASYRTGGFGEDDANVGRNYDLPFVQFVNEKGELTCQYYLAMDSASTWANPSCFSFITRR